MSVDARDFDSPATASDTLSGKIEQLVPHHMEQDPVSSDPKVPVFHQIHDVVISGNGLWPSVSDRLLV